MITQGEKRGAFLKQQAEERYKHQLQSGAATSVDIYSGVNLLHSQQRLTAARAWTERMLPAQGPWGLPMTRSQQVGLRRAAKQLRCLLLAAGSLRHFPDGLWCEDCSCSEERCIWCCRYCTEGTGLVVRLSQKCLVWRQSALL